MNPHTQNTISSHYCTLLESREISSYERAETEKWENIYESEHHKNKKGKFNVHDIRDHF